MRSPSYSALYSAQKQLFETGATRPYAFRVKQLKALKKAVKAFEEEITAALYQDLHKPAAETYTTEIGFVYAEIDYALDHLKEWMAPQTVSTPLIAQPSGSLILRDPLGLTLIIAPWNYPFQLLISPLVGAIAGGNCCILKPSEETPHTAGVIERLVKSAFPEEYLAVVQGVGAEVVPALMELAFDHVFFTGSVPVGKIIMAAAAKHLTPVTLELGGKSPCIVDKTASIKIAARRIAWGKFINAGQTCVAPDYVLVHQSKRDAFISQLQKEIRNFYGDDPLRSPDYPRMVNKKRFDAVAKFLDPQKIIFGGQTKEEELYIAPTLLGDVRPDDPVMGEEIFGPVLPIISFDKLEEVPRIIARNPYPLALYLFSSNPKAQGYILNTVRFGGGCINDTMMHLGNPSIPFGGVGTSGFGAYHGRYSFETFTHAKGVLKSGTILDIPLRYPPYTKNGERLVRMVMR